jgi:hypothetical protein
MKSEQRGNPCVGRRRFLGATAGGLAALSLCGRRSAGVASARAAEFGILDQVAPELKVDYWLDRNGEPTTFSIRQSRGKWLYINCFQNSCGGCHKYGFPTLKIVADAFDSEDRVAVVAVQTVFEGFDRNTRDAVRELQLRYDLPIPMGHDPGTPGGERLPSTMQSYRTGGTPWVIIIEPGGRVAYNDYHINGEKFVELLKNELG